MAETAMKQEGTQSRPGMAEAGNGRPKAVVIGVAVAAVLAAAGSAYYFLYARWHESTDDAFIEAHVVPISSNVAGHALNVYVDDNQQVAKGAQLVQIDPADYKVRLDQNKAALLAAEADASRTRADAARYQLLFAQDQVSKQVLDKAVADASVAAAQVEESRKRVDAAALDLSYTQIAAPEAGRVTRKAVEPGAYVEVGQPLMALVPKDVWVVANFKETQLTHMKPGQPVALEVDSFPGREFHGHIDSIQDGTGSRFSMLPPENATGNFVKVVQRVPVKIVFDDGEDMRGLSPGMSVVPDVDVH